MKNLAMFLTLVVLTGCGSTIGARVTAFDGGIAPDGKSYYIAPREEQEGNLVFRTYADLVETELAKHEFHRTDSLAKADYAVVLDYGAAMTGTRTFRDKHTKSTSSVYTHTFNAAFYTRDNFKKLKADKGTEKAYDVTVIRKAGNDRFNEASRCYIEFAFQDFPAENGTTRPLKMRYRDCIAR